MTCPCGQKNPPQALFCMACGRLLLTALQGERRLVSAVFFDLKDSTRLLAQSADRAYATFQQALLEAAQEARRWGGFVHRFLGDGLLVLFGAPRAQGKEAQRALKAALAMVQKSPAPARAGVATGEVLWTPLGSGQAGEATAVGLAVNLAERLSKLAPPGRVLADGQTLGLAGRVRAEAQRVEAPGFGVLEVYRVEGVETERGLPEGMEAHLEALLAFLNTPGGLLQVAGPPATGKTLLLEALLSRLNRPALLLPQMNRETPLRYTLHEALAQRVGEPRRWVETLPLSTQEKTLLLFSLGLLPRPPLSRLDLDEGLIRAWAKALAHLRPLVLILTDLHAPDQTLLRFLHLPLPEGVHVIVEKRVPLLKNLLLLPPRSIPEEEVVYTLQPVLDGLPEPARETALVLSVLEEAPQALLLAMTREEGLNRLQEEGLLDPSQGSLRLLPGLREAGRRRVPEDVQRAWHLRAAGFFRSDPKRAALHLAKAGEPLKAAQIHRALAHAAWDEGRLEEALGHLEEALALAPGWGEVLWAERQDLLASLGRGVPHPQGPRSRDPALALFAEARRTKEVGLYRQALPGLRRYPLEEAQARLEAAALLWRAFRPREALELLLDFPKAPSPLALHQRALMAGLFMDLGAFAKAQGLLEEPLPGQEDLEAKARLEAARIRFDLETGQLKKALRHAKGLPSHPWLAAASLPAYALLGLRRPDLAELARAHPDGQGLYLLTQGFLAWHEGEDPLPFFKKALRLGRALPNPYVFHMTASALALYLWRKAPKRAQALSQFLLRQTQKAGFAVHLELARLLRAQLLFEEGQEVAHLLAFTPTIPLTSAWRRRLLGQAGGEPSPAWGYGILGRWVLWLEPSPRGG